jgi:hypothetical protein
MGRKTDKRGTAEIDGIVFSWVIIYFQREGKVTFGSFQRKKPKQGSSFIKPNMPIKNKEDRIGSLKKSQLLSFNDDDIWECIY